MCLRRKKIEKIPCVPGTPNVQKATTKDDSHFTKKIEVHFVF